MVRKAAVTVLIVAARGLKNADWVVGGSSECYVSVGVVGAKSTVETKVVPNTLDPMWDQELVVEDREIADALEIKVLEKSGELLGEARLAAETFAKGFNGEVALVNAPDGTNPILKLKIRAAGQAYPAGPAVEFAVRVTKSVGQGLGMDIDILDKNNCQIIGMKEEGLVSAYNLTTEPETQVRAGDFIVSVNGVTGDPQTLVKEMQKTGEMNIAVRRPFEFPVVVERQDNSLKFSLNYAPNSVALIITAIQDGPITAWNKLHPDRDVKVGDRIVAVNGTKDFAAKMFDIMKSSTKVQLLIARPATDSAWWYA